MIKEKRQKIIFSGGGTGGSVTPLLAVAEKYLELEPNTELVFVGTRKGPERELVNNWSGEMKFISILSGKWRRYFSLQNILDLFKIELAFYQSLFILIKEKPKVLVSAGGFVSVPLAWAAWVMKIPVLIHQQDVRPGLANKLMSKVAKVTTVTFEKSLADYGPKAIWIGNPVNLTPGQNKIAEPRNKYSLKDDKPIILVIGGGTGAQGINELVLASLDKLLEFCQIIHLTGKNKLKEIKKEGYYSFDFLPHQETLSLMSIFDLIISRCGLGVLTELSALKKPAILIPMPNSHQEDNADLFKENEAAIILNQLELNSEQLIKEIYKVLSDDKLKQELSENIGKVIKTGASEKMVELIKKIAK